MPLQQLKKFLDEHKIKYTITQHSLAYTSQEIAEITHISAKEFAKTVIVKLDNKLVMVVLQGHQKVDFDKLKKLTHSKEAALASEFEFKERFPGCDLGAMPPFGNLYNMPVYVDRALTKDEKIAFNAGTHTEIVKMSYKDFERLVKPVVME